MPSSACSPSGPCPMTDRVAEGMNWQPFGEWPAELKVRFMVGDKMYEATAGHQPWSLTHSELYLKVDCLDD